MERVGTVGRREARWFLHSGSGREEMLCVGGVLTAMGLVAEDVFVGLRYG